VTLTLLVQNDTFVSGRDEGRRLKEVALETDFGRFYYENQRPVY
jgi:hypothetical protein